MPEGSRYVSDYPISKATKKIGKPMPYIPLQATDVRSTWFTKKIYLAFKVVIGNLYIILELPLLKDMPNCMPGVICEVRWVYLEREMY
jgi:hypothetical protein